MELHCGLTILLLQHDSGTIVDLVFSPRHEPLRVETSTDNFARSDHAFVTCAPELNVAISYSSNLGRVSWASHESWNDGLAAIEEVLAGLASSITSLFNCQALRPRVFGGTAGQKQRRSLLDMAAWARDVLYVVVGHCCEAVTCRPGIRRTNDGTVPRVLASHAAYTDF